MEGDKSTSEGICLKCARELGIKPVDDFMQKMGISDEELDAMTSEMMGMLGDENLPIPTNEELSEEDNDGKTATFPFLDKLFGSVPQASQPNNGTTAQSSSNN